MKKEISRFDKYMFVFYILLMVVFLIFKDAPGIGSGDSSYFSKIMYNMNIVPFYYEPNVSYELLVYNGIVKMIIFMPLVYFFLKYAKASDYGHFLLLVVGSGLLLEIIQLITLKGYFDVTDIFYYIIGTTCIYILGLLCITLNRRIHKPQV